MNTSARASHPLHTQNVCLLADLMLVRLFMHFSLINAFYFLCNNNRIYVFHQVNMFNILLPCCFNLRRFTEIWMLCMIFSSQTVCTLRKASSAVNGFSPPMTAENHATMQILCSLLFPHLNGYWNLRGGQWKKYLLITEFTNSRHNPETIIFFSNVKQKLDTCETLSMQNWHNTILLWQYILKKDGWNRSKCFHG